MSIATLILGESGTGKSSMMKNLDPKETLLIQAIKKPLPFRSKGWAVFGRENKKGNIFITDNSERMVGAMQKSKKKVIVIDDFQYLMANELMNRYNEKGYDRFTDIARHAWDVLRVAGELPEDVRVYILSHTTTDEFGHTKIKTIGKMLDDKITIEGMFTIVLRTIVSGGEFQLSTVNNGQDTVKSPIDMFKGNLIDNDLKFIDESICDYYEIIKPKESEK